MRTHLPSVIPYISHFIHTAFPFIRVLQTYQLSTLRKDLVAGATVAAILIPQSMAYALLAGLPPVHGLYAALFGSAVGALWGSSPYLATGPVAIVSFLSASLLLPLAPPGSNEFIALSIILAIIAGIMQFLIGALRLGFIMRFVPQSVIIGFSSAAAIIIALTQIPGLMGIHISYHEYVFQSIGATITALIRAHPLTSIMGITSLLLILWTKKIAPRIPFSILLVFVAVGFSLFLNLERHGVQTIGLIPNIPPIFHIPPISAPTFMTLVTKAAIIAMIGFVQTFAVARLFSKSSRQSLDVNQELVGQGLANTASGLFGGYSVSGSLSLTAVKHHAGAVTAFSGVFTSVIIFIVLASLAPLLSHLPKTILSAMVIAAMIPLIDFKQLQRVSRLSRSDGIIALGTFALSFLFKPDVAIVTGVVIALVVFLNRVMTTSLVEVGLDPRTQTLKAVRNGNHIKTFPNTLIVRVDMSVVYINSERIFTQLDSLIKRSFPERTRASKTALILDCSGVNYIDFTALEQWEIFHETLLRRNTELLVINAKYQLRESLTRLKTKQPIRLLSNLEELKRYCDRLPQSPSERRHFAGHPHNTHDA